MNPIAILLLGFAMSTDAFAAAVAKGAAMTRPRLNEAMRAGAIFGGIEAITPVLGWLLGRGASRYIQAWDHWLAFGLLVGLGLHMIWTSMTPEPAESAAKPRQHGFLGLALTGLSTSIDALAVGVGLAFVEVSIVGVAVVIGLCTFGMVTVGIMLGRVLSAVVGRRAELAGGLVLIVVGAVILYEHLSA